MNGNTTFVNSQYNCHQPNSQADNGDYVDRARLRAAEQRRREREQVEAAIASELDLVLRGLPYADTVLRYAAGELASLRDVLVATEPGAPRQLAALRWLDDAGDELNARWAAYELVMASRDPRREAIRRERDFFAKTAARPALADDAGDAPPLPTYNPQTFVTTLTKRQDAGRTTEWTSVCPMTKDWRVDAAAYGKRVQRLVSQLREEQQDGATFHAMTLDAAGWEVLRERWKKRAQRGEPVRWAKLPQEDGAVVVIHDCHQDEDDGSPALASDAAELRRFVFPLLRTPEGAKVTTSPALGGCYQGARGDGRRRQAQREGATVEVVGQFVTSGAGGVVRAAQLLNIELSKGLRGRRELNHEDAVIALLEAGFQLLPRHVHQAGLAALLAAFVLAEEPPVDEGDVSPVKHKEEELPIVTYTGHTAQQDALLVDFWPPGDGLKVVEPAPIYLAGGATW